MADERQKGKGRKSSGFYDETLQVRVRKRNPQIERRASVGEDTRTAIPGASTEELAPEPVAVTPRVALGEEKSDTTQEFELERPREKPRRVRSSGKKKAPARPADGKAPARAAPPRPEPAPRSPAPTPKPAPLPVPQASADPGFYLDEEATEIADEAPGGRAALGLPPAEPRLAIHPPPARTSKKAPKLDVRPKRVAAAEAPRVEVGEARLPPGGPQVKPSAALTDRAPMMRSDAPQAVLRTDAVPRELLGKWGTDAVGPNAQRAAIQRFEQGLPQVQSPALKLLRAELNAEELGLLSRTLEGELDQRGVEAGLSPKRSLEHLINEPHFNDLSLGERARLLRAISAEPRDIATIKSAIALVKTGVSRRLRAQDRERLFQLFLALESETRAQLARVAARALRGRSALEDHDLKDTSLLAHLLALAAERPLAPAAERVGVSRQKALANLLGALAHPERLPLEESGDGVLGMLEFGLADSSPAELARLWLQLLTGDMSAELCSGEGRLDLAARLSELAESGRAPRDSPLRLGLEELAALARPKKAGGDRQSFMMPGRHGVDADVISRALGLLYGVGFTVAAGSATARRHLARAEREVYRVPPIYVTLLYERGERLFLFDHADEANVYLRAPHGRSTKRKGTQRTDPPRWVESPELGIDRVSSSEFDEWVGVALIPRP